MVYSIQSRMVKLVMVYQEWWRCNIYVILLSFNHLLLLCLNHLNAHTICRCTPLWYVDRASTYSNMFHVAMLPLVCIGRSVMRNVFEFVLSWSQFLNWCPYCALVCFSIGAKLSVSRFGKMFELSFLAWKILVLDTSDMISMSAGFEQRCFLNATW